MHIYIHTSIYIYIYIYVYMHMHMHMHMHMYMYAKGGRPLRRLDPLAVSRAARQTPPSPPFSQRTNKQIQKLT